MIVATGSDSKNCVHCGEVFFRKYKRAKRAFNAAKYCSCKCAGAARAIKGPRHRLSFDVSDEESRLVYRRAVESGLRMAAYIRTQLGFKPTPTGQKPRSAV